MLRVSDSRWAQHDGYRACFQGVEGGGSPFDVGTGAYDDNRRRRTFHDGMGGLKTIHIGHVDVHCNDIRALLLDGSQGFGAVVDDAHHLDGGIRREDMHQEFLHYA